jgi:hypothetical protein
MECPKRRPYVGPVRRRRGARLAQSSRFNRSESTREGGCPCHQERPPMRSPSQGGRGDGGTGSAVSVAAGFGARVAADSSEGVARCAIEAQSAAFSRLVIFVDSSCRRSLAIREGRAFVNVRDEGRGMERRALDRAFDRRQQDAGMPVRLAASAVGQAGWRMAAALSRGGLHGADAAGVLNDRSSRSRASIERG